MGQGYTRQDTANDIDDGKTASAVPIDAELDQVEAAFHNTTGHTHDGTAAEGGPVTVIGPVQDVVVTSTEMRPKVTDTMDLGTSTGPYYFRDLFLTGNITATNALASVSGVMASSNSGGFLKLKDADGTSTHNQTGFRRSANRVSFETVDGSDTIVSTDYSMVVGANGVSEHEWYIDDTLQVNLADGVLYPETDSDVDLGKTGQRFKNLYIDGLFIDTESMNAINGVCSIDGSGYSVGALFQDEERSGYGNYIRFPNGVQICWRFASFTAAIDVSYYGGYRSAGQNWEYAAPFSTGTAPRVVVSVENGTAFGAVLTSIPTENSVSFAVTSISSDSSAARRVVIIAIGRYDDYQTYG